MLSVYMLALVQGLAVQGSSESLLLLAAILAGIIILSLRKVPLLYLRMDVFYWIILVGWVAYLSFSVCCGLVSIDYLWIHSGLDIDNLSSTQTNPSIFDPLATGAECLRAPLPTPLHHVELSK